MTWLWEGPGPTPRPDSSSATRATSCSFARRSASAWPCSSADSSSRVYGAGRAGRGGGGRGDAGRTPTAAQRSASPWDGGAGMEEREQQRRAGRWRCGRWAPRCAAARKRQCRGGLSAAAGALPQAKSVAPASRLPHFALSPPTHPPAACPLRLPPTAHCSHLYLRELSAQRLALLRRRGRQLVLLLHALREAQAQQAQQPRRAGITATQLSAHSSAARPAFPTSQPAPPKHSRGVDSLQPHGGARLSRNYTRHIQLTTRPPTPSPQRLSTHPPTERLITPTHLACPRLHLRHPLLCSGRLVPQVLHRGGGNSRLGPRLVQLPLQRGRALRGMVPAGRAGAAERVLARAPSPIISPKSTSQKLQVDITSTSGRPGGAK